MAKLGRAQLFLLTGIPACLYGQPVLAQSTPAQQKTHLISETTNNIILTAHICATNQIEKHPHNRTMITSNVNIVTGDQKYREAVTWDTDAKPFTEITDVVIGKNGDVRVAGIVSWDNLKRDIAFAPAQMQLCAGNIEADEQAGLANGLDIHHDSLVAYSTYCESEHWDAFVDHSSDYKIRVDVGAYTAHVKVQVNNEPPTKFDVSRDGVVKGKGSVSAETVGMNRKNALDAIRQCRLLQRESSLDNEPSVEPLKASLHAARGLSRLMP